MTWKPEYGMPSLGADELFFNGPASGGSGPYNDWAWIWWQNGRIWFGPEGIEVLGNLRELGRIRK